MLNTFQSALIHKLGIRTILIALISLCVSVQSANAEIQLTKAAQFSILTCSPGSELYSLFGHTAIRVQDQQNGKIMDLVFNYGTFDYSDDFYVKFAMGKLDYILSVSRFGDFQKTYIDEYRGMEEQILLLDHSQKIHLWALLQTNYQPEHQTYRYDFFYDNCSTRARDMILLACSLGKQYPVADSTHTRPDLDYAKVLLNTFPNNDDPSHRQSLSNDRSVVFTYAYPKETTFREAIDQYLVYQPWSDFGIDIALGLPCDRTMLATQAMFLPDSLKKEYHIGTVEGKRIVSPTDDLLFNETELIRPRFLTPFWVFTLVFLTLAFLAYRRYINWITVLWTDRLVLIAVGLIGVLIVFLWFITDHHATVNNLNILWAHPLWLYMAFDTRSKRAVFIAKLCVSLTCLTLITFALLPQQLHIATIPLMLCCVLICAKVIVRSRRLGHTEPILVTHS